MIIVSEEDKKLFEQNGFTKDQVQATVEHYRAQGLSDNDIQNKINAQILNFRGNEQPSQPIQPSQPEYKQMSLKEVFSATPEELNENMRALGRDRLQQREQWEQNHPVISEIQKAFQPNYRADLIDMQNQAQYGMRVPLGQMIKSDFQKTGQNLVPSVNLATAVYTGGLGTAKGLLPSIGKAAIQGGIQGGVEGLTGGLADEGLSVNAFKRGLQGTGAGATVGGLVPVGGKVLGVAKNLLSKPVEVGSKFVGRIAKGAGTGTLENFGISKNAFDRMKVSPRGISLSENYEKLGSPEFITDVAEKFKNGVEQLRNMEIINFAKARDNLLAQNKDLFVDLTPYTQKAMDKIKSLGFINEEGLTRAGQRANKLTEFLDDLDYYSGRNLDINELQSLKSDVLDDIIDYRPQAGQKLNNATRSLQKVAKEMRKDVNNALNEKLGSEYGAINKRLSEVLDILDNNPELKDLTNAQSIDMLANKLKRTGTTRLNTGKELQKLEKIMNDSGIKISDYSLIDDILDYNVAKEMNTKIGTGLMGGMANIARRAAAQPVAEGVINAQKMLNPTVNQIQNVGRKIKPVGKVLQSPTLYSGLAVPTLQGGVVYNDYRD